MPAATSVCGLVLALECCAGLAIRCSRWRVVGRNATPAWRVRGLRFFSDTNCSTEIPARTGDGGCAARSHRRVDGSALAWPPTPTPAASALSDSWWESRRPCPATLDECYVGFAWQGDQIGLPGAAAGFSSDAGCHGTARFARGQKLEETKVEPQCISLEQGPADSDGGPAQELAVQCALRSNLPRRFLLWYTIAVHSGGAVAEGGVVRLRVPLAAPSPLGGNETAPRVSIGPATVVLGHSGPSMTLTCPACSGITVAFLGKACDDRRKNAYGVALHGSGPAFTLTVDITPLVAGRHYPLCLDLDGMGADFPVVQSAVSIYASAATRIVPTAVQQSTCSAALVGPLANRAIADAGISASSYRADSGEYGFGQMWRSRLDSPSGSTWCAESMDPGAYIQWDLGDAKQITKVQTKGRGGSNPTWVTRYILHFSLNGFTWTPADATFTGNSDGDTLAERALGSTVVARFVQLRVAGFSGGIGPCLRAELLGCQALRLHCDSGCSSASAAYLGGSCNDSLSLGVQEGVPGENSPATALVPLSTTGTFALGLDASGLSYKRYTLCIDADGSDSELAFGDTLLSVDLLGFTPSYPPTMWSAPSQALSFTCQGCSSSTDVALAEVCAGSDIAGVRLALTGSGPSFGLSMDASGLVPGRHYRLCVLPDRADTALGFHDAGQAVYVTGIRTSSFASIGTSGLQAISFECPGGCSSATTVYLGSTCDHTDLDGSHSAEPPISTASVPVTQLTDTHYSAVLNASTGLNSGLYFICADLDGIGTGMAFGDTRVAMTVS